MSVSAYTAALPVEMAELEKVSRKAERMFTHRKIHRRPMPAFQIYRTPSSSWPKAYLHACGDCGRECSGQVCRECYSRRAHEKYEAEVRAEDERVKANEAAYLNVVQRKESNMATSKNKLAKTPITRSTSGLRTALFEEMEALRQGTSNAQRARSVAMMANSILQSVQVEIEYHKYVNANQGKVVGESKVVSLGTDIPLAA